MSSASRLSARSFTLFSVLWAAATLFHMASYSQWGHSRYLALAAGWVLLQPGAVPAMAVLAVLEIYKAIALSPFVPNHWIFTTFVNTALLLAMGITFVRRRRIDRADLYEMLAPAVRVSVLLLYAFVVFHKLNADFFDPEVSCGTEFYAAQLARLPFLPQTEIARMGSIYAAIGFEAVIPLLLAFPVTRAAGMLVGALFHVILAINPIDRFYNFSSMMLALFSLFAPATVVEALNPEGARFKWFARTGLAAIVATLTIQRWVPPDVIGRSDPFFLLWNVYAATVIGVFLWALWRHGAAEPFPRPRVFAIREPLMAALPILVVLNGIAPYVGLKTETAWAMFSNLRTEGDRTNHFLVPAGFQPFDYQRDLVRVVSSSDRMLAMFARKGLLVPYFELRRRPTASVVYVRNGVEYRFAKVSDDPAFGGAISASLGRVLMFRAINAGDKQPCAH
jgi:hypothetical protein